MDIRQAIVTKYLPASNTRGSRIKATAAAGSITIPYPHEAKNTEECHASAARAFAAKYDWKGVWFGGGTPDCSGYVFVTAGEVVDPAAAAFTII